MSLRVRLLAALLFAAVIALVIVDIATYTLVTRAQLDQVDGDLERSHPPIERAASAPTSSVEQAIREVAPGSYVEVRDAVGTVTVVVPLLRPGSPALQLGEDDLEPRPGTGDDAAAFGTIRIRGSGAAMRVRVSRQGDGGVLVIGQPLEHVEQTRKRMIGVLVGGTLAALAAVAVLGAWFVRLGLAPLSAMERAAAEITETDLDRRVPGYAAGTEVGRLAATINNMLERLHRQEGEEGNAAAAAERVSKLKCLAPEVVRAGSLFSDGELSAAENTLRAYLLGTGDDVEALRLLARIDHQYDVLDEAESLLEAALERAPDYRTARLDYVRVLIDRQKYLRAREEIGTLLRLEPDNSRFLSLHAAACAGLGNHEAAIALYRRLLSA